MIESILEIIRGYVLIDSESLTILFVMVGWATLLVHIGVESRLFTAIFIPGMLLGGLGSLYLSRLGYLPLIEAKDVKAIMLSVIGIIVGFIVTVLVLQVIHWIGEWRRPLTLENRR